MTPEAATVISPENTSVAPAQPEERAPVMLNVGCGSQSLPKPWINIDRVSGECTYQEAISTAICKPDVVAECDALPYEDNSVDVILASHLLEHLGFMNGHAARALKEWERVLRPGGELLVIGPDCTRAGEHAYLTREWGYFWACHKSAGHGNPLHPHNPDPKPGVAHQWNCTEEALVLFGLLSCTKSAVEAIPPTRLPPHWPVHRFDGYQAAVLIRKLAP